MIIRSASEKDITAIMDTERASFIPQIQEKKSVFLERIKICRNCFIVFEDEKAGITTGYFSAERWSSIPLTADGFALNHNAADTHTSDGPVLYLSSFALLPQYRGKGAGYALFVQSISWFKTHNSGLSDAVLLVNESWQNAAYIYQSYGFSELFRLPFFFPANNGTKNNGIVMNCSF
jgi:[ribosomal protein S18]-alanine N-acetyltransferase